MVVHYSCGSSAVQPNWYTMLGYFKPVSTGCISARPRSFLLHRRAVNVPEHLLKCLDWHKHNLQTEPLLVHISTDQVRRLCLVFPHDIYTDTHGLRLPSSAQFLFCLSHHCCLARCLTVHGRSSTRMTPAIQSTSTAAPSGTQRC